jgi:phosphate/sulfate permease
MQTFGLIILILVALGFDFTNGFHGVANVVAVAGLSKDAATRS